MKKFLEATIKVKHVLIALVLLIGMAIGFAVNRPHFRPKKQMARVEHRVQPQSRMQMRGRMDHFKDEYNKLSDVEKHAVDSLRSLIKKGNWEDNRVIFQQIREIVN